MENSDLRVAVETFVDCVGRKAWSARMAELKRGCVPGYAGRALAQMHALELTIERFRRGAPVRCVAETCVAALADQVIALSEELDVAGNTRLRAVCAEAMAGENNFAGLFHLVRTAAIQRARGYTVRFSALQDGASFDLLLTRDDAEAEIVCDVISAEDGRFVHRGAFSLLMDRVDPDLQSWLSAHPGRYLLKMTLPLGLKSGSAGDPTAALAALHARITRMLGGTQRADHDAAAVLRLDPLLLAGAQAGESGLMRGLRREFGPEAHLAVTQAGDAMLVMAARASREDEVAEAVQRRMAALAPTRLTGTRPGILAMFIEDTDRLEWDRLRDQLRLEGATRQFLTRPEARAVVAVSCASRLELLGSVGDGCADGEMRFRNPSHPQAKLPALASAVLSN